MEQAQAALQGIVLIVQPLLGGVIIIFTTLFVFDPEVKSGGIAQVDLGRGIGNGKNLN